MITHPARHAHVSCGTQHRFNCSRDVAAWYRGISMARQQAVRSIARYSTCFTRTVHMACSYNNSSICQSIESLHLLQNSMHTCMVCCCRREHTTQQALLPGMTDRAGRIYTAQAAAAAAPAQTQRQHAQAFRISRKQALQDQPLPAHFSVPGLVLSAMLRCTQTSAAAAFPPNPPGSPGLRSSTTICQGI